MTVLALTASAALLIGASWEPSPTDPPGSISAYRVTLLSNDVVIDVEMVSDPSIVLPELGAGLYTVRIDVMGTNGLISQEPLEGMISLPPPSTIPHPEQQLEWLDWGGTVWSHDAAQVKAPWMTWAIKVPVLTNDSRHFSVTTTLTNAPHEPPEAPD